MCVYDCRKLFSNPVRKSRADGKEGQGKMPGGKAEKKTNKLSMLKVGTDTHWYFVLHII